MSDIDPEIMIAVLNGEATDDEEGSLAEWRAESLEHEREYRRLARLWAATGELDEAWRADPPVPDARTIIEEVEASSTDADIPAVPREPSGRRKRSADAGRGWRRAALAASLVLGVGLGALLSQWVGEEPYGARAMVTGMDEVATVTLEDETVVRLAPQSRLKFSRDGGDREVSLRGRAFFAVAPQQGEPFRVRLSTGTVEVLGTRFDVQSRGDSSQVAVVEGKVRMDGKEGGAEVNANQVARASKGAAPEVREVDDVFQVVDWVGRFLAFESTPMKQVAEEMQRRFGIRVEIADGALRERTVTGWFADQPPEEMMAGICRAVNARCTVRDGTVRMELSSSIEDGSSSRSVQAGR